MRVRVRVFVMLYVVLFRYKLNTNFTMQSFCMEFTCFEGIRTFSSLYGVSSSNKIHTEGNQSAKISLIYLIVTCAINETQRNGMKCFVCVSSWENATYSGSVQSHFCKLSIARNAFGAIVQLLLLSFFVWPHFLSRCFCHFWPLFHLFCPFN